MFRNTRSDSKSLRTRGESSFLSVIHIRANELFGKGAKFLTLH